MELETKSKHRKWSRKFVAFKKNKTPLNGLKHKSDADCVPKKIKKRLLGTQNNLDDYYFNVKSSDNGLNKTEKKHKSSNVLAIKNNLKENLIDNKKPQSNNFSQNLEKTYKSKRSQQKAILNIFNNLDNLPINIGNKKNHHAHKNLNNSQEIYQCGNKLNEAVESKTSKSRSNSKHRSNRKRKRSSIKSHGNVHQNNHHHYHHHHHHHHRHHKYKKTNNLENSNIFSFSKSKKPFYSHRKRRQSTQEPVTDVAYSHWGQKKGFKIGKAAEYKRKNKLYYWPKYNIQEKLKEEAEIFRLFGGKENTLPPLEPEDYKYFIGVSPEVDLNSLFPETTK